MVGRSFGAASAKPAARNSATTAPANDVPASLSPGDQTAIDPCPGAMHNMPPPTPLLPGRPTRKANSPLLS